MPEKVHFIGIGGIGMSAVARMYLSMGYEVQGSDLKKNEILHDLEQLGAKILIGHDADNIEGADCIVYSSSIKENHPERIRAVKNRIKILHRSEALAEICRNKFTIAVTGTHGKTTTTAMIGMILRHAGRDPSIVVGGVVQSFGGNACAGSGKEIVIEADESDSSFLNFSPSLTVVTNIEEEHMDHFLTFENIEKDYIRFIERLPSEGKWIGCAEDPEIRKLALKKIRPVILYGFDPHESDIYASNILECPNGKRGIRFEVFQKGSTMGEIELKLIGRHNVLNALAAIAAGLELGLSFSDITSGLEKYEGAGRRFDVQYENKDYLIVDDYAHHPTEIQKTIEAAKTLGRKRLIVAFQPHRYSRTQALLNNFASAFNQADELFITDIYAASEAPIEGVSGQGLAEAIQKNGFKKTHFVPRKKVLDSILGILKPGDQVLVLGAGDICQVSKEVAGRLLFQDLKGKLSMFEPLSKHTSLKVGGACRYWIEPEDAEDLKKILRICRENNLKWFVLGLGSNVLAKDDGFDGVVIHLNSSYFKQVWRDGEKIGARAGIPNTLFIQQAALQGFGGFEFLMGIPGSIGGAIAMNAGSHNQSVDQIINSVRIVTEDGEEKVLTKAEIPFHYRSSGLRRVVIVEAFFNLPKVDKEAVQKKLDEYKNYRMKTQDLKHPSAGCMFKNPLSAGCSSGKLIDDAGLKGTIVGRAQVSFVHGNFIINLGGATAEDVQTLIRKVQKTVKEKFGIDLETEVQSL